MKPPLLLTKFPIRVELAATPLRLLSKARASPSSVNNQRESSVHPPYSPCPKLLHSRPPTVASYKLLSQQLQDGCHLLVSLSAPKRCVFLTSDYERNASTDLVSNFSAGTSSSSSQLVCKFLTVFTRWLLPRSCRANSPLLTIFCCLQSSCHHSACSLRRRPATRQVCTVYAGSHRTD